METITYTLTETDKKFQSEIKTLIESGNSYDTQSIFTKIQIGIKLVEMKQKNPIDFDSITPESLISKKTRNRRIQLVIKKDCDFSKCMKVTKDRKTTKENSKLLILDKRVVNLTETKSNNQRDKHQPEGMDRKEFIKMVDNGIYPVIKNFYDSKIENEKLEKNVKSPKSQLSVMKEKQHKMDIQLSKYEGMLEVSGNIKNLDIKTQQKVKNF